MNDAPLTKRERVIVWAAVAACVAAALVISATALTAYIWTEENESTISDAGARIMIANRPPTDATFHERLKTLRKPPNGWTAERRTLERRAMAVLRRLETVHEPALLKRGRTEPDHETAASR